jgi:hypothetical protein
MSKLLLVMLLSFGAQLNPSLVPQSAPKPSLPKIDQNVCPFEGCKYGPWIARKPVQLFSSWKSGRAPVAHLSIGEHVTAVTGVNITYEPDEIEVTAPIPQYELKAGDRVFGYMNLGEGVFNAWFNGKWVSEFDGSGISSPNGSGCSRKCTGRLLKEGRFEWWVQIRNKQGIVGWTHETDKFDGKDSLAAPE